LPFYGTGGSDPFAPIAAAGEVSIRQQSDGLTVVAAAVFGLAKLGSSPPELARIQQLLAHNGVREKLVLAGGVTFGASTSVFVNAVLDVDLRIRMKQQQLLIEDAFVSFGDSNGTLSFQIGGVFGVRFRVGGNDYTFTTQAYLAITPEEATAGVTIDAKGLQLAPLNVFMSEVAADIVITFEELGIGIGLEAKLAAGKKHPVPALEVAALVTLDDAGEAVYPNIPVFMISIPSLTYDLVLDILGVTTRPPAADFLSAFALYGFYVGWAEGPGFLLPDRTPMPAGLAVQGMIRIASFEGWLALDLSGSGQSFAMSCNPIHWHGVEISGDGKEIKIAVVDVMIGGQSYTQPVMGARLPDDVRWMTVVRPGGPSLQVNLEKQPFLDLGVKVRLFMGDAVAATKVVVSTTAVTFELELKLPRVLGRDRLTFRCSMLHDPTGKQVTGFSAKTRIWFEDPKIPVIDKIERFRGWLEVDATIDDQRFHLKAEAWVHFHWLGVEYKINWEITFTESPTLDELAKRVAKELERSIKKVIE
jgi:hypothetical protein